VAGNLSNVTYNTIDDQISYIFEELCETIDSIDPHRQSLIEGNFPANYDINEALVDRTGLLDGACDLFVTVVGLLQKLEAKGYDVGTALQRVCANNLTKFPEINESFTYDSRFTETINEKYGRCVIKDENGKVRKPNDFAPVDLSDLIPQH
jgi:hypothetical protein